MIASDPGDPRGHVTAGSCGDITVQVSRRQAHPAGRLVTFVTHSKARFESITRREIEYYDIIGLFEDISNTPFSRCVNSTFRSLSIAMMYSRSDCSFSFR